MLSYHSIRTYNQMSEFNVVDLLTQGIALPTEVGLYRRMRAVLAGCPPCRHQ